jgi:hypothetical protein
MNDPKPWSERNHYSRDEGLDDLEDAAKFSAGVVSACIIAVVIIALVAYACF